MVKRGIVVSPGIDPRAGIVFSSLLVVLLAVGAAFAQAQAPFIPNGPPQRDFIQHRLPTATAADYVILQFRDPPLASYDGGIEGLPRTRPSSGPLDLASAASDGYRRHLARQHKIYRRWLLSLAAERGAAPQIVHEFSVTFNGIAVQLNGASPERLAEGPGVDDWSYSRLYRPSAGAGVDLINATDVWPRMGGLENAGAGVRVGVIDSGIDERHAAFSCKESIPHKVYFSGEVGADDAQVLVLDHGTHVAGIIGGCALNHDAVGEISGVAPGVELWDYNVFPGFGLGYENYSGAALAHDVMAALEQAVADGMDVINLSLQGRVERSTDFLALAVNSAVDAGAVVAVAAGNTGPGIATIQSPGGAAKALTAGASGGGHLLGVPIVVSSKQGSRTFLAAGGDFDSFSDVSSTPGALVNWADTGGAVTACVPAPDPSAASGKIVLINDGGCSVTTKIRHAERAGARGVIVYSNMSGPPFSLRHDGSGALPGIAALMVSSADGAAILDGLPATATLEASQRTDHVGGADVVAGFSSRGPSPFDHLIKPDVTAPGVNVLSPILREQFAAFQGTSVAASHVSGAAAVLRQLHPEWSASDVRSAIVNTAAPLLRSDGEPADLLAQGSGRIDLFAASRTPLIVDPVSASFGFWREGPVMRSRELRLTNVSGADLNCSLASTGPAMLKLSDYSIELMPGATANIRLDLDAAGMASDLRGEFGGEIQLACSDTTLRVPWWVGIDLAAESEYEGQAKDGDPTECADLVVTDFRISPTFPIENQNADIEIDVKNQGTCDSLSFLVQWKSAQFAPTGPTDFILGLAAGATTTANFQYAFPTAGNFTTVATVDSDNTVEEFNEANNIEILPVTVLKEGIDLVITDFDVEPAAGVDASIPPLPVQNRLSRTSITIQNLGNRAAGDFLVRWIPGILVPALSSQVNGLEPGASTTVFFDYTYAAARTTTTTARVDSSFAVSEVDETNNVESMSLTIEPQESDLEVTALVINPAQPVRGIGAEVTMVVRNRGNTAASSFIVDWRPTPLAAPLARQINGLDVGASTIVNFDYTYNFDGTFTSTATLDRTNQVDELNEDNNTRDLEVFVEEDFIDLQIIEMDIRSGPPGFACQRDQEYKLEEPILTQGQNVNICLKIINNGNAPSNSFVVEWNPDALGLITPSPGTLVNQIDTVGPGEVVELPIDYIYNQHGNFRAVAEVDAFRNVDESNEANQLFLENVVVLPSPIDLVITEFVIVPTSPIRASKATARITVKNNGPYPTDSFFVRWKPTGIDAGGGPTAQVLGLNAAGQPDDSVTVEIESTFRVAGPYTSFAEVDTFDQIIEANETNNVAFRSVEVQPRETTMRVDFDSLNVIDDMDSGIRGDGDWIMLFVVLDPNATCNVSILGQSISEEGFQCQKLDDSFGEGNLPLNKVFNVTLLESFPLVYGTIGIEDDLPTGIEFAGYVLEFWSAADYRGVGARTVPGLEGDCSGGRCFDLNYEVGIVSEPPVLYSTSGSGEAEVMKSVIEPELPIMLPDGLAQLLPQDAVLPEELTRNPDVYWDWVRFVTVFSDDFESGDLSSGWTEGSQ
jgi:minor extracellular serine protease Vpr